MNLLVDRLPDSIEVCGGTYAIHTDYRYWVRFETMMLDGTVEDAVKIATLLTLCYKEMPPSLPEAFSAMLAFYLGRDMEGQGNGKKSRTVADGRRYIALNTTRTTSIRRFGANTALICKKNSCIGINLRRCSKASATTTSL